LTERFVLRISAVWIMCFCVHWVRFTIHLNGFHM
jgi:hypothetical protein